MITRLQRTTGKTTLAQTGGRLLALYLVVAAAVWAGALSGVDQWSATHLMRELHPNTASASSQQVATQALTSAWTMPASALGFSILFGLLVLDTLRRRRFARASTYAVVVAVCAAVELISRYTVTRPAIFAQIAGKTVRASGLSSSFPSGHALRASLLVYFALVWLSELRRSELRLTARLLSVALPVWLVGTAVLMVDAGWHTPTDVIGGVLLAATAVSLALGAGPPAHMGSRNATKAS